MTGASSKPSRLPPSQAFPDVEINDLVAYKVFILASLLTRRSAMHFRQYLGLTAWEARTIAWLGGNPGLSLKELATRTRLDKGQISRVVAELTARGFVERKQVGRSISLSLTPTGSKLYDDFSELAARHEAEYTAGMTEAEREALRDRLDQLIARVVEVFDNDPYALTT